MRHALMFWRAGLVFGVLGMAVAQAASWVVLTDLRQGARVEWRLEGVPETANPYDPDLLAVEGVFREPGGGTRVVPAFWYRDHRSELRNGTEVLTATGEGEWRLRYYAWAAGTHEAELRVRERGGEPRTLGTERFEVGPAGGRVRGFARVAADRQFFEVGVPGGVGEPLALVGADVCWHGVRGTYDYQVWFPAMAASGWNWGRLWMWPFAFGIEAGPGERLNYRQDRAWQLDRVFGLAEEHGLLLLLCLDYHGMFETEPDYWGGNNQWPRHPYNAANGGPCATPRSFFTEPGARDLYRKRLRYLVARYGASPSLHAWQFFNEIDNVYRYLNAGEVAQWHGEQGAWLKAHDPWGHLVTTSLTGGSVRPEIWDIPSLDFAVYHSYAEASPARRLSEVVGGMRGRFGKPVLVGEAGVDWRGWARTQDPFLRGFRQLLWGGLTSGSAGTSMSWWWESIHSENVYPYYRALTNVVARTTWPRGSGWEAIRFGDPGPAPSRVGELLEGGAAFDATLMLDTSWGGKPLGRLAVAEPTSAGESARRLNSFVHGTAHSDLRVPFVVDAWVGEGARLVLHVNSVSDGAVVSVRANGTELYRRGLPNKDRAYLVNNEYNEDLVVGLPAGRQSIEIRNLGSDWFYLDWVRLERVLPARYENDWRPVPAATGIGKPGEMLVHVVATGFEYPTGATVTNPPPRMGEKVTVLGAEGEEYGVVWYRTTDGGEAGRGRVWPEEDGRLVLFLPPLVDELVGHLVAGPALRAERGWDEGSFVFRVEGRSATGMLVERSEGAGGRWEPWEGRVEPSANGAVVRVPQAGRERGLFRVRWD